jgi:hypothetical protein
MLSEGAKPQTMMKELRTSPKNLKKWRTMLENIPAEVKAKFDKPEEAPLTVEEEVIPVSEKEKAEKKPKKKGGKKKKGEQVTVEDIDNGVQPSTKDCPVEEIPTDSQDE